jgi:hypothetical protein
MAKWNKSTQEVLGRTSRLLPFHYVLSIWYDTDRIENNTSESISIVACVFVAAKTSLLNRCLATIVLLSWTIQLSDVGGRDTDAERARWYGKPLFFFKIRKVVYKIGSSKRIHYSNCYLTCTENRIHDPRGDNYWRVESDLRDYQPSHMTTLRATNTIDT